MIQDIFKHKKQGKIVGFTCSSFDLCHAGHCAMLAEAKTHCDILVIGLQTNPTVDRPSKNLPVQTVFERWVQIQAIKEVDFVVPYETEQELQDMLLTILPHKRIIGEEYQGKPFTGHDIEHIEHVYNSRRHSFSSSSLRRRMAEQEITELTKELGDKK